MRKLALLFCLALLPGLLAADLPPGVPAQPSQPVTDLAGMLSTDAAASLNTALGQAWQQGKFQLAVLTLPGLQGAGIEDVSIQVARAWGLGDKQQGNGVLLLVAPTEHRMRIEVGSRLEGDLTDAACSRIINDVMAPRLREGDNDAAVLAGCQAIVGQLGVELNLAAPAPRLSGHPAALGLKLIFFIFIIAFVLIRNLFTPRSLRGRSMAGWGGGVGGGGFSGGGGYSGGGGGFSGGGASGGW
jgi:uncharacterized protein